MSEQEEIESRYIGSKELEFTNLVPSEGEYRSYSIRKVNQERVDELVSMLKGQKNKRLVSQLTVMALTESHGETDG